jgi:nitrate/TMAO reductase-like tetraheme cytochrome c subunit
MNLPEPQDPERPSLGKHPVIALFTSHWLAMVGFGLVITAIVVWSCLLSVQLRDGNRNPYIGLAMTGAGGVLLLGMILTPLGLLLGRRRLKERLATSLADRKVAWGRLLVFLVVTSLINLLIVSQLMFRAVHAMESKQFCTSSCHVMTPEARAFDQGPHAGILCVDCHVGDGALGFVKSKLQGTKQLYAVLTDHVAKPIESAIAAGRMVPSNETCENCHWKNQPAKVSLRMFRRYDDDKLNTPMTTLLTMNVGGDVMGGIHGSHHGPGVEIRFVATDPERQDIPLVEYTNSVTGQSRTYVKKGAEAAAANLPRIKMQCFDCHNRPAHAFNLPDRAVDRALLLGRMSVNLPFLKKTAVEILKAEYPSSDAAATQIPATLMSFYQKEFPGVVEKNADDVREAGAVLADIYSRNVFPDLGVTWGTYPDNRGHEDFPGCFRCHDGEHATPSGETITKNCFRCHFASAVEDTKPEVLELLGLDKMMRKLEKQ